jgi:hypothetical protein
VQKIPAISCPFFRTLPSECIPEAMEDFNVHLFLYSMPFHNKFIGDKTLSIKGDLQHNLPSQYIQEAMEDFNVHLFIYSKPFHNKFRGEKTLSIKEDLQHNLPFALVLAKLLSYHS